MLTAKRLRLQSECGQAMLFVALLVATVSTLILLATTYSRSSIKDTMSSVNFGQTFYYDSGMMNLGFITMSNYLNSNPVTPPASSPPPSNYYSGVSAALTAQLNASLPSLVPQGYTLNSAQATVNNFVAQSVISSGPFKGMASPLTTINLNLQLSSLAPPAASVNLNSVLTLGAVYPYQFILMSNLQYTQWTNFGAQSLNGHVHANGDICLGSKQGLNIAMVTASGNVMHILDARCADNADDGSNNSNPALIATDGTFQNFNPLWNNGNSTWTPGGQGDNSCTNCSDNVQPATSMNWKNFALAEWNGNVMDSAHGVSYLKIPGEGLGSNPQAGQGWDYIHTTPLLMDQTQNMRFIVDPALTGQWGFPTDDTTVLSEKYSYQADIRILDGVWYIQDKMNPNNWPGIAIWSDHPASATTTFGNVGQDDIKTYWAANGHAWGATPPVNYSFYSYDEVNNTLFTGTTGVVSYGSLTSQAPGSWLPGSWIDQAGGTAGACAGNGPISCPGAFPGLISSNSTCTCGGTYASVGPTTHILNAARSGFMSEGFAGGSAGMLGGATAAQRTAKSLILPVNFDVNQFQTALQNTNPGELGSYFQAAGYVGRPFNGIIWVGYTWPGALTNFGNASIQPAIWPNQGLNSDPIQSGLFYNTSPTSQSALPYPLCSSTLGNTAYDSATSNRFVIPRCSDYTYGGGALAAYPNGIRLINGATLSQSVFPKGFTFATNLPFWITGDYNKSSDVSSSTATSWVSAQVAGDNFEVQSNGYMDDAQPWGTVNHVITPATGAQAVTTTVNTAIMTGFCLTRTSVGFQGIPGTNSEDWSNAHLEFTGSIVVGYYPVFYQSGVSWPSNPPALRDFVFDPHFSVPADMPPGTPIFPVYAISGWASQ